MWKANYNEFEHLREFPHQSEIVKAELRRKRQHPKHDNVLAGAAINDEQRQCAHGARFLPIPHCVLSVCVLSVSGFYTLHSFIGLFCVKQICALCFFVDLCCAKKINDFGQLCSKHYSFFGQLCYSYFEREILGCDLEWEVEMVGNLIKVVTHVLKKLMKHKHGCYLMFVSQWRLGVD